MTQEEKARAYDEALERAKFYHGNCPSEPERKKLEEMFPQLRESEDERIRKEMIAYFAHRADVTEFIDEGEDCKRWISYLEKQKEQKPAEWSEEDERHFKACVRAMRTYEGNDTPNSKWIEALKDRVCHRPHWKPSEEQMEALEKAMVRSCGHQYGAPLSELCEQLRKL